MADCESVPFRCTDLSVVRLNIHREHVLATTTGTEASIRSLTPSPAGSTGPIAPKEKIRIISFDIIGSVTPALLSRHGSSWTAAFGCELSRCRPGPGAVTLWVLRKQMHGVSKCRYFEVFVKITLIQV